VDIKIKLICIRVKTYVVKIRGVRKATEKKEDGENGRREENCEGCR
jgi:hypothetical protein